jgi:hypothetical protein
VGRKGVPCWKNTHIGREMGIRKRGLDGGENKREVQNFLLPFHQQNNTNRAQKLGFEQDIYGSD